MASVVLNKNGVSLNLTKQEATVLFVIMGGMTKEDKDLVLEQARIGGNDTLIDAVKAMHYGDIHYQIFSALFQVRDRFISDPLTANEKKEETKTQKPLLRKLVF